MKDLEAIDLKVTASLLRAGLLPAADVPAYADKAWKAAIRQVTELRHYAWRGPR